MQPLVKVCPLCHRAISSTTTWCEHCGRNLPQVRRKRRNYRGRRNPDDCEIVADGTKFGIMYRGEIKVRGIGLETARILVEALNSRRPYRKR